MKKFKIGDRVRYRRVSQDYFGGVWMLRCTIIKINNKTFNLTDGETEYRNVKGSNLSLICSKYPSHINA